jgi:hypothetical protein
MIGSPEADGSCHGADGTGPTPRRPPITHIGSVAGPQPCGRADSLAQKLLGRDTIGRESARD